MYFNIIPYKFDDEENENRGPETPGLKFNA